jgi:hypothetical protein
MTAEGSLRILTKREFVRMLRDPRKKIVRIGTHPFPRPCEGASICQSKDGTLRQCSRCKWIRFETPRYAEGYA